ncbi:ABC transporter ATP-binding protein [Proteinivorax hydrogeniformans]|uniref:ABC transporter ATP-binding protein n=1 Tax=Proteinivorax hydrogeniformans TaxID=1826727 RepID=A0AAU8HSM1_9FIRM
MSKNTFREDEQLKETMNIKVVWRLLSYLAPHKLAVIKTMMLMMVVVAVEVMNPFLLKLAIDFFIEESYSVGLVYLGVAALTANLIAMLCSRHRVRIMAQVSNGILKNIRQKLFNHIQKLSFSFFDNRPLGKILSRIIGDVNSLKQLFNQSINNLIPDIVMLTVVVMIMLAINVRLALMSFILLPALVISMFVIQTIARKRWQKYRQKRSNLNAFIHEDYSGIRVVQSFARERHTSKTFDNLSRTSVSSFLSAMKISACFWPLVELSWGVGTIIIFWYGINLINVGDITPGDLVAFSGYIGMFWRPINNLSNFYNSLITNLAGAERIFEVMDITPDIVDCKSPKILPSIKGKVQFENVTFKYDKDGETVLKNVSFKVDVGETIALVGHTGAGKTTIVNLLTRFFDTTEGKVVVDGFNVKEVTIESLRSQMGIMTQDTFLFSGSIKENIRYGKLDATDEEIIKAAKSVYAHDFITKLKAGYDTDVNERGASLSMGQRQLIALARTLLADPKILILDEATSSIDTYTEMLVQDGLKKLLQGRTSFIIAHRLSTIRNADRIMVIDDGQIIESGNHKELMDARGKYYKLTMAQYKFLKDGA